MRALRNIVALVALSSLLVAGAASQATALVKEPRRPVPIVLDRSQFQGPCDPNASGAQCAFWYSNGSFAIGDANWGFLDLDQWNVRRRHTCAAAGGASARADYILHSYPRPAPSAGAPRDLRVFRRWACGGQLAGFRRRPW